jgi:tetratricopeptide (TPR) repeat protein
MAWRSDDRTAYGEGVSYGGTHNLHMLFFAGSMDGQGQVSKAAAEEYARQVDGGVFYQALVLLRFGEFREILELNEAPEQELRLGLWEFARGYAHLKTGAPDSAAVYLDLVDERASTIPDNVTERNSRGSDLLSIVGDVLRGEILRSEGRLDEAIAAFEEAVTVHDGLEYAEPEALNFSSRHWLGAALLEAGRYAEAEQVYRDALDQHPNNGWSFYGLAQALGAQGRTAEAAAAEADFDQAWERADIRITSSRF